MNVHKDYIELKKILKRIQSIFPIFSFVECKKCKQFFKFEKMRGFKHYSDYCFDYAYYCNRCYSSKIELAEDVFNGNLGFSFQTTSKRDFREQGGLR